MLFGREKQPLLVKNRWTGCWAVVSSKSVVMIVRTEQHANQVKGEMDLYLKKWDLEEPIEEYLYRTKQYEACKKWKDLVANLEVQERFNVIAEKQVGTHQKIFIVPEQGIEPKEVRAYCCNKAFAVYESDGWNMVHVASGYTYARHLQEQHAIKLARVMMQFNSTMNWEEAEAHGRFLKNEELQHICKQLRKQIENGEKTRVKAAKNEEWEVFWGEMQKRTGIQPFLPVLEEWKRDADILQTPYAPVAQNTKKKRRHVVIMGPSGVGKTTMAKKLAKALYILGHVDRDIFVEVSRKDFASMYEGGVEENFRRLTAEANGGVLFLDEFYALKNKQHGGQGGLESVIDMIVAMTGQDTCDVVFILAGYELETEAVLDSNEGLPSRIPHHIRIVDFTPDELANVFCEVAIQKGYCLQEGIQGALCVMLERMKKAGKMSGNARSVEELLERIESKMKEEWIEGKGDGATVTIELLRHIKRQERFTQERKTIQEKAKARLHRLYGMDTVKTLAENWMHQMDKIRQKREMASWLDEEDTTFNFHTLILGNPGTAKTELAGILGEYISGSGMLAHGRFIKVSREDLVDEYIGGTAIKTKRVLKRARGGVLFIDEFYRLVQGDRDEYGKEALETIMEYMNEHKEEIVCIAAAYPDKMDAVYRVNPGLRSRFQHKVVLGDYTPLEIIGILKEMLQRRSLLLSEQTENELARAVYAYGGRHKQHFEGNGRWCEKVAGAIANRCMAEETKEVTGGHVRQAIAEQEGVQVESQVRKEGEQDILKQAREKAACLIGGKEIKQQLEEAIQIMGVTRQKKEAGLHVEESYLHSAFLGPSGVGKTTWARLYAMYLRGMGYLSKGTFHEITKKDLVKDTVAETTKVVEEWVSRAQGGALFLDEAYGLISDPMGHEIIREFLTHMEKPGWVLLLAGYEGEMKDLFRINEGFLNRLGEIFVIPPCGVAEVEVIIHQALSQYTWDPEAKSKLKSQLVEVYGRLGCFEGNARWALERAKKIEKKQSLRLAKNQGILHLITASDIEL